MMSLIGLLCGSFDHQLEQFGVNLVPLKEAGIVRIFRAWVEDWEEELLKKNDCVAEARLLEKYKNLVFLDPDTEETFTVFGNNLEFRRGRDGGWNIIAVSSDESVEDEGFVIGQMLVDLIAETEQAYGVQIIHYDGSI